MKCQEHDFTFLIHPCEMTLTIELTGLVCMRAFEIQKSGPLQTG